MAINRHPLDLALQRSGLLYRLADLLRGASLACAVLLAAWLAVVLADATLALPAWALIVVDAILAAIMIGALVEMIRIWRRSDFNPLRLARMIETAMSLNDNRLINAVELANDDQPGASAALKQVAVESGVRFAEQVRPAEVIDRQPAKRALLIASAAWLVVLVMLILTPRIFAMVVPRLIHPLADLPPFTLVQFDITTEPNRIYFGRPATIRAALSGPISVQSASVVFVDNDRKQRVPMLRSDDNTFVLPIERTDRTATFYIDTPHGRSGRHLLNVLPIPTFEKVTVSYQYPNYTAWPAVAHRPARHNIRAIRSTKAALTVQSNMPLQSGRMTITHADKDQDNTIIELVPLADDPTQAICRFDMTHTGRFSITLTAANDAKSDKPYQGTITSSPDEPPVVTLLEPDLRIMAPEGWVVPVEVIATDDVAVKNIELHLRVNKNDNEIQPNLTLDQRKTNYAIGRYEMDLSKIGTVADDCVKGFARAIDSHPTAPNTTDSPTFEINVLTQKQYEQMLNQLNPLLMLNDELIEKLQQLADKMQRNDGQLSEHDAEELEKLLQQLAAQAELWRQLAEQLSEQEMEQLIKALIEAAGQCKSCNGKCKGGNLSADDIKKMIEALKKLLTEGGKLKFGRGKGMGIGLGLGLGLKSQSGPMLIGPHLVETKNKGGGLRHISKPTRTDDSITQPEQLDPTIRRDHTGSADSTAVPLQYRNLVQKYFRKLATDSK